MEKTVEEHDANGAKDPSTEEYAEIGGCASGATTWTEAQSQAVDAWLNSVLNSRGEDADAFREAWGVFMADFGCRGSSEIDIAAPRWEETPRGNPAIGASVGGNAGNHGRRSGKAQKCGTGANLRQHVATQETEGGNTIPESAAILGVPRTPQTLLHPNSDRFSGRRFSWRESE